MKLRALSRNSLAPLAIASILTLGLTACGGSSGGGGGSSLGQSLITALNVNDAATFSDAIEIDGAQKITETISAPSSPTGGSLSASTEVAITAGGTSGLSVTPTLTGGSFVQAYLIRLSGATDTFVIPVNSSGATFAKPIQPSIGEQQKRDGGNAYAPSLTSSTINISGLAGIELTGIDFEAIATIRAYLSTSELATLPTFTAADFDTTDPSRWTEPSNVNFRVVNVGSGDIQITLTWDTDADLDLYLLEPDNNEISFTSPNSVSGDGFLDFDDVDGFGPENIFFDTLTPVGTYTVSVDLYDFNITTNNTSPVNYTVTVKANGTTQTFTGVLTTPTTSAAPELVTTFTIN